MRLIDADVIQWTANGCGHPNCKDICEYTKDDGTCCGWLVVNKRDIDKIPTIDAEPVRYGEWIDMGDFESCSVCHCTHLKRVDTKYGEATWVTWVKSKYCPHCGAKMDGGEE